MKFNTAIFYDVENLLKGYGFSQRMARSLSLKDVLNKIRATELTGNIAIQRAYANWSDPRLGFMRNEILEMGVEPVQVFGFSFGSTKNVADIQLAIDAIDLAYTRTSIDIFVIVSGDGGFASLAKKLHEYGKTVIGCAYQKTTNRVFAAVSDRFVWIPDPDNPLPVVEEKPIFTHTLNLSDPRVARLAQAIKPLPAGARAAEVIAKLKEMLRWFAEDAECAKEIQQGLHLSVIRESLKYAVPDFQSIRYGYPKFIDFMRYVCSDMNLCIYMFPPSEGRVGFRNYPIQEAEILTDLEAREAHTIENYRAILTTGLPIFRLPRFETVIETAIAIQNNPIYEQTLSAVLEKLYTILQDKVSPEHIKFSTLCLLSGEVLQKTPENLPLAEQLISSDPSMSYHDMLFNLQNAIRNKIYLIMNEIREDIFLSLFE